jgi:hypothetical protein
VSCFVRIQRLCDTTPCLSDSRKSDGALPGIVKAMMFCQGWCMGTGRGCPSRPRCPWRVGWGYGRDPDAVSAACWSDRQSPRCRQDQPGERRRPWRDRWPHAACILCGIGISPHRARAENAAAVPGLLGGGTHGTRGTLSRFVTMPNPREAGQTGQMPSIGIVLSRS